MTEFAFVLLMVSLAVLGILGTTFGLLVLVSCRPRRRNPAIERDLQNARQWDSRRGQRQPQRYLARA